MAPLQTYFKLGLDYKPNKNFSLFINEYRIEEAKRILDSKSKLKIEVIAEMCGFNSNSTFYSVFKKITNTTPAKYSKP